MSDSTTRGSAARGARVRLRRSILTSGYGDLVGRLATVRGPSPYSGRPRVIVDVDGLPEDCPFYLLPDDLEAVDGD